MVSHIAACLSTTRNAPYHAKRLQRGALAQRGRAPMSHLISPPPRPLRPPARARRSDHPQDLIAIPAPFAHTVILCAGPSISQMSQTSAEYFYIIFPLVPSFFVPFPISTPILIRLLNSTLIDLWPRHFVALLAVQRTEGMYSCSFLMAPCCCYIFPSMGSGTSEVLDPLSIPFFPLILLVSQMLSPCVSSLNHRFTTRV